MSQKAVVKIGGSQFKVAESDELLVAKLGTEKGKTITFDQVLLLFDDQKVEIGQPLVKKASVKAKVIDQVKGKKIRVATYKAKSRYRRVKGHRSLLTKIRIEKIEHESTRKKNTKTHEKK